MNARQELQRAIDRLENAAFDFKVASDWNHLRPPDGFRKDLLERRRKRLRAAAVSYVFHRRKYSDYVSASARYRRESNDT